MEGQRFTKQEEKKPIKSAGIFPNSAASEPNQVDFTRRKRPPKPPGGSFVTLVKKLGKRASLGELRTKVSFLLDFSIVTREMGKSELARF
ncbi:hypothetical protein HNY73_020643 [Argiope bruennichi]|uniref:Uncharacterized protein n=1 Tax=Argiope bruennichi TaxID=94029 RepID=A0A8T0E8M2_ARGBR|nr:hypothetical protein HNY73_020643 [Argiope bruennichi]